MLCSKHIRQLSWRVHSVLEGQYRCVRTYQRKHGWGGLGHLPRFHAYDYRIHGAHFGWIVGGKHGPHREVSFGTFYVEPVSLDAPQVLTAGN